MKKFYCENCEKEFDFVYLDGYLFGDTLLEGVSFKIDKDLKCIGVADECKTYMKKMDWLFWKGECEEFSKVETFFECPKCGEDVVID